MLLDPPFQTFDRAERSPVHEIMLFQLRPENIDGVVPLTFNSRLPISKQSHTTTYTEQTGKEALRHSSRWILGYGVPTTAAASEHAASCSVVRLIRKTVQTTPSCFGGLLIVS
jgi:hypothetical protein